MKRFCPLLIAGFCSATSANALDLGVPVGALQTSDLRPADTVTLPTKAWSADTIPQRIDGDISRRAYRVAGGTRTTLQLLEPLRTALTSEGFQEVFTCADSACGGFDFRFQLDLIGEPEMHVDLGDFRYLLAKREPEEGTPHTVSIVTSRSANAGFIHITEVSAPSDLEDDWQVVGEETVEAAPRVGGALVDRLVVEGHVVLNDLDFGSGSSELGDGPFPSLETLATWLIASNGARVVLVGHTDAEGSLEANTALSLKRAQAVASRLVESYGVASEQVDARGAGYLAPVASNLSDTGRALNRRVEVVLLTGGQQ